MFILVWFEYYRCPVVIRSHRPILPVPAEECHFRAFGEDFLPIFIIDDLSAFKYFSRYFAVYYSCLFFIHVYTALCFRLDKKVPVFICYYGIGSRSETQAVFSPRFKYRYFIPFLKYDTVALYTYNTHVFLLPCLYDSFTGLIVMETPVQLNYITNALWQQT